MPSHVKRRTCSGVTQNKDALRIQFKIEVALLQGLRPCVTVALFLSQALTLPWLVRLVGLERVCMFDFLLALQQTMPEQRDADASTIAVRQVAHYESERVSATSRRGRG
eukprot:6186045-Pleurochrysis_carterae.AAC.3